MPALPISGCSGLQLAPAAMPCVCLLCLPAAALVDDFGGQLTSDVVTKGIGLAATASLVDVSSVTLQWGVLCLARREHWVPACATCIAASPGSMLDLPPTDWIVARSHHASLPGAGVWAALHGSAGARVWRPPDSRHCASEPMCCCDGRCSAGAARPRVQPSAADAGTRCSLLAHHQAGPF